MRQMQPLKKTGYTKSFFVDADHVNADCIDDFIEHSDYFTIDISAYTGKKAASGEIDEFLHSAEKYTGSIRIPGLKYKVNITRQDVSSIAEKYLFAAIRAFEIYRKIEKKKGKGNFITEISIDEVSSPQSPAGLLMILRMLALENIPVQAIAPRFPGRFNKGIDYRGDIKKFSDEFEALLLTTDYAVREFGLPGDLKLSLHSGSDKFSLYGIIGELLRKHDKGIHLKTAGTTWLEELTGLADSKNEALVFVKELYFEALDRIDELCAPYAEVLDIKTSSLPSKNEVAGWDSPKMAATIRHDQYNKDYNPDMRQLLHVSYKLAAEKKDEYFALLEKYSETISRNVFENICSKHICKLFGI